jgi:uncharacterized spore protein YtfJ
MNMNEKQQHNTPSFPVDSVELLSLEDKMILYASLQEMANELRRIHRERKKNQQNKQQ